MVGNTVETLLDTAYNDVRIIGATPGTQVLAGSNKGKDFRRTNGLAGGFYASGTTNAYVPAVAGGVTGFVAQIVKDGDKGLGGTGIASGGTADPSAVGTIAAALASATTSASHFTGQAYLLDIAQAAAQAFGWVSHSTLATVGLTAPSEIVLAIYNAYPVDGIGNIGWAFGTKLLNAANFGFTEANGGGVGAKPGAGAEGLRDGPTHPYYDHHSASGTPVSNIFNL